MRDGCHTRQKYQLYSGGTKRTIREWNPAEFADIQPPCFTGDGRFVSIATENGKAQTTLLR
jgi:hypothetical protein